MTFRAAVAVSVALALALGVVRQGVAEAENDRHNAATHYQRAIDRLGTLSQREKDLLWNYEPSKPPSPELRAALRKAQPILEDFHRGSLQGYADFNLDHSQGIEMLLPHLAPMRSIARIAKADVGVRLHDGDTIGAANRIAAVSRSVTHFGDDRTLLSSLVGQSVFTLTDGVIQSGIDRAAFNAADALKMLQPLQQLADDADPFNYLECLVMEQEAVVGLANSMLEAGADAETFAELFMDDPDEGFVQQWMDLTQEEFDLHVQAYDEFMLDVVDVFAMEDPELAMQEMDRVVEEYLNCEHNLLAEISIAYGRVLERKLAIDAQLDQRIAALQELVDGRVHPTQVANAAVWYLRGIDLLNQADATAVDSLRQMVMNWQSDLPDDLEAMLAELGQQVVEEFRDGSQIRRCDFLIARDALKYPLVPTYLPGMRDVFRLLHADAIRLWRDDEFEAAMERLVICYRVIGHLSGDDQLLSALTSHVAFEHTHLLIDAAIEEQRINDAQRRLLAAALDRISRADPFGYGNAVRATRAHGVAELERINQWYPDEQHYFPLAADAIGSSDGDRLLVMLALHEAFLEEQRRRNVAAGNWPHVVTAEPPLHVHALADVILLDELDELREQVGAFARHLMEGKFDGSIPQMSPISDIALRRQQARSVLRIAASLLHTTEVFGESTSEILRESRQIEQAP